MLTAQELDAIAAERARRGLTIPLDQMLLWAAIMMDMGGPRKLAREKKADFVQPTGTIPLYHFAPHEFAHAETMTTSPEHFGKNKWSASERKADGTTKTFERASRRMKPTSRSR